MFNTAMPLGVISLPPFPPTFFFEKILYTSKTILTVMENGFDALVDLVGNMGYSACNEYFRN
ncbi:MAG: hypothetical protein QHH15_00615 [Candidatus Thermoplasmatota archaeon]|nr:hypothetical protein [Candidatus Thermoplasmatota archaeon]